MLSICTYQKLCCLVEYFNDDNNMLYSRDDVVLALCNSATSTFAGFVIFFYLESLANILGLPVDDVAESGPSLAFIVYPYAVTKLPAVPLWSISFFLDADYTWGWQSGKDLCHWVWLLISSCRGFVCLAAEHF